MQGHLDICKCSLSLITDTQTNLTMKQLQFSLYLPSGIWEDPHALIVGRHLPWKFNSCPWFINTFLTIFQAHPYSQSKHENSCPSQTQSNHRNPVRREVSLLVNVILQQGVRPGPILVIDSDAIGQIRTPPAERSDWHNSMVAEGQNGKIDSVWMALWEHYIVPMNVLPGPLRVIRTHYKLHFTEFTLKIFHGILEVTGIRNNIAVALVIFLSHVPTTNMHTHPDEGRRPLTGEICLQKVKGRLQVVNSESQISPHCRVNVFKVPPRLIVAIELGVCSFQVACSEVIGAASVAIFLMDPTEQHSVLQIWGEPGTNFEYLHQTGGGWDNGCHVVVVGNPKQGGIAEHQVAKSTPVTDVGTDQNLLKPRRRREGLIFDDEHLKTQNNADSQENKTVEKLS